MPMPAFVSTLVCWLLRWQLFSFACSGGWQPAHTWLSCSLTWLARPTLEAAARVTSGTSSTAPSAASPAALIADDEAASAGVKTVAMSPVIGVQRVLMSLYAV
jgi:hypothetical protein